MTLDGEDIEAIAQRVAELLHDPVAVAPVRLVDAQTVASVLGVDREWVYAHAQQLSAIRLGGPHGRLRFDLHHVTKTLVNPTRDQRPRPPSPAQRTRRHQSTRGLELLPIES